MAAPQMKLQLMTNNVTPRKLDRVDIPVFEECTTQIYKGENGTVRWRFEDDQNRREPGLIARLVTFNFTCVLEPYVSTVTVEPLLPSSLQNHVGARGVTIPASEPSKQCFIYLRSDDTVHFVDEDFKVNIVMDAEQSKAVRADGADDMNGVVRDSNDEIASEIQVKSSNVEPRPDGPMRDDDATHSDDDLDDPARRTPNDGSAQALPAPDTTPATSRPTEMTVKETPIQPTEPRTEADHEELYSTARDKDLNDDMDTTLVGEVGTPSPLAQKMKPRPSRSETVESPAGKVVNTEPTLSGLEEEDEVRPSNKPKVTYGNKRTKRATLKKGKQSKTPIEPASHDREQSVHSDHSDHGLPTSSTRASMEPSDQEDNGNDGTVGVLTSDPPTNHDAFKEAAKRSMPDNKRKHVDEAAEMRDGTAPENKKQRLEAPDDGEDADDSGEESTERLLLDNSIRGLKSRTPKVKKPKRGSRKDSRENIVVATTRPSPEVLIGRQSGSETPDSTPSSTLTGKVPKILLSSESAIHKNNALKKWIIKMGASMIDTIPSKRAHFVCVVPKEHSLKSAKVLHSLAMDKCVVADDWLITSKTKGELLDYLDFVHEALEKTATHQRDRIFARKRLFFTTKLVKMYKSGWTDIQAVAKEAGAIEVDKVAFDKPSRFTGVDNLLFFGVDGADEEAARVMDEYGRQVYSKELFTHSIISGQLALEEKFEIKVTAPTPAKKGRRS